MNLGADDIVDLLGLAPQPEGGFYRESVRDDEGAGGRARSTAIYYLLRAGEVSRWHRVDAGELWHFYLGDPLELSLSEGGGAPRSEILGRDLAQGARPQVFVPAGTWQCARPLGRYTLAGCTVAPGFEFSGFEMAPADWQPDG